MCDPVTLGIAVATGVAGKLVSNSESVNNANAQAAAANQVLQTTLGKEQGFQGSNTAELDKNLANYAPGAQDTQLAGAQTARANTSTGNMTTTNPNSVPVTSDAPPAVAAALKNDMASVDAGSKNRATLAAKLGGYGDSLLTNQLNTASADRNIGVTNNFADGQKAILPALQQDAMAGAYKPPSIWSTILGGGSQIAAGAAGSAGKSPVAANGTMNIGDQTFPTIGFGG